VLAASSLNAAQDVRVFVEADEEGRVNVRSEVLETALQQGVFQEAEELLRGKLDESRRFLLQGLLSSKASEYVLGYEELEYESTDWGAVLHMDVRVNRQALRGFLQSLGTYYTLDQTVGYVLDAQNLTSEDATAVQELEILSGVRQDASDSPSLRLVRGADGTWQGMLDFEGLVWSAQAMDLPLLWADLWGNYFTLERVRQMFEDSVLLTTHGWGNASVALGFDQVLRSWDSQAAEVELVGVSLRPEGVQAQWKISTMDRDGLEARLIRTLRDMDIVHSIQ